MMINHMTTLHLLLPIQELCLLFHDFFNQVATHIDTPEQDLAAQNVNKSKFLRNTHQRVAR